MAFARTQNRSAVKMMERPISSIFTQIGKTE